MMALHILINLKNEKKNKSLKNVQARRCSREKRNKMHRNKVKTSKARKENEREYLGRKIKKYRRKIHTLYEAHTRNATNIMIVIKPFHQYVSY